MLAGSRESELEAPRAEDAGLRPFRAGLVFGAFNGLTWMIGLGTPMVLFAEALGANALQVGLATSFLYLVLPVQVLATASLARLGYRRQMVMGWWIRALFLLVPLALALMAPERPAPWMANALVASVLGFCILRAFGTAAHLPWMAHILPVSVRGRFFATDNALTSGVGVGTLLLCATLFERFPGWTAFALVYGLALAGSVFAVASLMQLPDAPGARARRAAHAAARGAAAHRRAGRVPLLPDAHAARLERERRDRAVRGVLPQGGGRALGGPHPRLHRAAVRRTDRRERLDPRDHRPRAAAPALPARHGSCTSPSRSSGSPSSRPAARSARWIPLAYFGLGVAIGVTAAAHFTMLPELSPPEERPVSMAVFTSILGVAAGLAPILWGLVLKEPGPHPGLHVDRFAAFFAYGAAAHALLLVLYRRLPDRRTA